LSKRKSRRSVRRRGLRASRKNKALSPTMYLRPKGRGGTSAGIEKIVKKSGFPRGEGQKLNGVLENKFFGPERKKAWRRRGWKKRKKGGKRI